MAEFLEDGFDLHPWSSRRRKAEKKMLMSDYKKAMEEQRQRWEAKAREKPQERQLAPYRHVDVAVPRVPRKEATQRFSSVSAPDFIFYNIFTRTSE